MWQTHILCSKKQKKCKWSHAWNMQNSQASEEVFQLLLTILATLFTWKSLHKYAGNWATHMLWRESIASWQNLPQGCPWRLGDQSFREYVQPPQQWKLVLSLFHSVPITWLLFACFHICVSFFSLRLIFIVTYFHGSLKMSFPGNDGI